MKQRVALPDATLAALIADVETSQAKLHAYLVQCGRMPAAAGAKAEWPARPDHPDLMSVSEAAVRANRDTDTIGRWCKTQGIGKKYGGRWRVSRQRVSDLLTAMCK